MFLALASLALAQAPYTITRDDYGVPHIKATSSAEAFKAAGYVTAQDRMWQMELSRRLARGHMAEILGSSFVASDREVLQTQYTDDELQQQVDHLSPALREAFVNYAAGVNQFLSEGHLPPEFAKYH